MKEIKKYNKMIEAFECDMTLARNGEKDISELDFRYVIFCMMLTYWLIYLVD